MTLLSTASAMEAVTWQSALRTSVVSGELCAAMDARRHQVYNARFRAENGTITRLTEDRAIALEDLIEELRGTKTTQIVLGDGARLCWEALTAAGIPARLAPPNLRQQTAWGVARLGLELAKAGRTVPPEELVPVYHRLSQAERERLAREKAKA